MARISSLALGLVLVAAACGCGVPYLEYDQETAGAQLKLRPLSEVAFGSISPYGAPLRQQLWVAANGDMSVAIEHVVLPSDGRGSFTLVYDPSPAVLEPGEEVPIDIRFHPDESGQFAGRLSVIAVAAGQHEISRRLVGSGCGDADADGSCNGQLPDWDPVEPDTGDW